MREVSEIVLDELRRKKKKKPSAFLFIRGGTYGGQANRLQNALIIKMG